MLSLLLTPFILTGCATCHLSTESLVQQMANSPPEKKYIYLLSLPFIPFIVEGSNVRQLTCLAKNGKEATFEVTNRTSVRLMLAGSSHTTFYFNTLLLKDSTISGSKTHFFEMHIKPVKLRDLAKIEVQKS
jgi:hypothetical protein